MQQWFVAPFIKGFNFCIVWHKIFLFSLLFRFSHLQCLFGSAVQRSKALPKGLVTTLPLSKYLRFTNSPSSEAFPLKNKFQTQVLLSNFFFINLWLWQLLYKFCLLDSQNMCRVGLTFNWLWSQNEFLTYENFKKCYKNAGCDLLLFCVVFFSCRAGNWFPNTYSFLWPFSDPWYLRCSYDLCWR